MEMALTIGYSFGKGKNVHLQSLEWEEKWTFLSLIPSTH